MTKNFWIKKYKTTATQWQGGRTDLHFAKCWDLQHIRDNCISFNDAELEELRKVLRVDDDCESCPELQQLKDLYAQGKVKTDDEFDVRARFISIENDLIRIRERVNALDNGKIYKVHMLNHKAISDTLERHNNRLEGVEEQMRRLFHYEG